MVCDKCGMREATSHYRVIINGRVSEEHLCSMCAVKSTMQDDYFSLLNDFFAPSFDFGFMPMMGFTPAFAGVKKKDSIIDQAKNSIRIGANKFRDEVRDNPNSLKIMNLRRELAQAVEVEDYERASSIKKEIENLEKGDNNV